MLVSVDAGDDLARALQRGDEVVRAPVIGVVLDGRGVMLTSNPGEEVRRAGRPPAGQVLLVALMVRQQRIDMLRSDGLDREPRRRHRDRRQTASSRIVLRYWRTVGLVFDGARAVRGYACGLRCRAALADDLAPTSRVRASSKPRDVIAGEPCDVAAGHHRLLRVEWDRVFVDGHADFVGGSLRPLCR